MANFSHKGKAARYAALVGIMAATVECAKLALAAIPNVEVVTLLLALYGYTFGVAGIVAAIVFVCIEPLIWGFGTWMISYFIYWPLVAATFMMLSKCRIKTISTPQNGSSSATKNIYLCTDNFPVKIPRSTSRHKIKCTAVSIR